MKNINKLSLIIICFSFIVATKAFSWDVNKYLPLGGTSSQFLRGDNTWQNTSNFAASGANTDITSLTPGTDFTLNQNSVVPFKSISSGAIANTLVLDSGRVSIGTATSSAPLHVYASNSGVTDHTSAILILEKGSSSVLQFQSANTQTATGIVWGDPEDNDVARMTYDHTVNRFNWWTSGTQNMVLVGSSGQLGVGTTTPSAIVHIKAGTSAASTAPLKFTSGTVNTTPEVGAVEYDGTNLLFTRSATRESVITANAVNVVSPSAPNRTITVIIDGTTYYLHAKTTND